MWTLLWAARPLHFLLCSGVTSAVSLFSLVICNSLDRWRYRDADRLRDLELKPGGRDKLLLLSTSTIACEKLCRRNTVGPSCMEGHRTLGSLPGFRVCGASNAAQGFSCQVPNFAKAKMHEEPLKMLQEIVVSFRFISYRLGFCHAALIAFFRCRTRSCWTTSECEL